MDISLVSELTTFPSPRSAYRRFQPYATKLQVFSPAAPACLRDKGDVRCFPLGAHISFPVKPNFSAEVDLVSVYMTVVNDKYQFVNDLRASDWGLKVDRTVTPIVAHEPAALR